MTFGQELRRRHVYRKVKVEVDRQRAIVEAIDAVDGFREDSKRILAPLYAKDESP